MNYDTAITKLIEVLKTDKSIMQPWRNKAIARAEEVQAFIRFGKSVSLREQNANIATENVCTCPSYPHALASDCPKHGGV